MTRPKYNSSKFVLACATGLIASFLQWYGKLDAAGNAYALIITGTVAAYIAGNVTQRKNEGPTP